MSWALWITGPPSPVLVEAAAGRLRALGEPVTVLELDRIGPILTPEPDHSDRERALAHRALAHVAAAFVAVGLPVIVAATADGRAGRDAARALGPRFAEVRLNRFLDPKGRPADVPPEPAPPADLSLDMAATSPEAAAEAIVALAQRLAAGASPRPQLSGPGCVVWITGRPGTGKTTLARGVAAGLGADGVVVTILEFTAFRDALRLPGTGATEATEVMAHRAVVCAAKLLAEAGVAVIVDAATPRRAWRELARRTIPPFAEVQLLCPLEISIERERAIRWCPGPWTSGRCAEPDICADYEESPMADLTVHTHVIGRWSAVDEGVRLARRLLRGGGQASTLGTSKGDPT